MRVKCFGMCRTGFPNGRGTGPLHGDAQAGRLASSCTRPCSSAPTPLRGIPDDPTQLDRNRRRAHCAPATPVALQAQRPTTLAGRSTVYAPNGVVATSQPLATTAGLEVLRQGGNAIDAAVTAAAVLSVTEPMMTGIGGDMFAIVWIAKEKKLVALNASGRAGSLMTRETLSGARLPPRVAAGRQVGDRPRRARRMGHAAEEVRHVARSRRRCSRRSAMRATASPSRRSSPKTGRTRRRSFSATRRRRRRSFPAATRRRPASGSEIPTTRARCARSPTRASARSTVARSASASSRDCPRSAASSRSTT